MSWPQGPRIPAEPFVTWLHGELERLRHDQTIAHTEQSAHKPPVNQALADRLGISARRLHDYLHRVGDEQPDTVFRSRVEDMLENAGLQLWEVYPDLIDDVELEPDAYCERCRDTVSPIGGLCPWCDSETGPLRRGGWKRPDIAGSRYTDAQLRVMHIVHIEQGVSINELGRQTFAKVGYKNYQSAARAIGTAWSGLGLAARDRIEATVLVSTIHGRAPRHGSRVGYKRWLREQRGELEDQPLCIGIKRQAPRKGQRCRRPAMFGSEYCVSHEPSRELARQAALARMRLKQPRAQMLPMAPFADWLLALHREGGSLVFVVARTGLHKSAVARYEKCETTGGKPKATISHATVLRAATRAGVSVDAIYAHDTSDLRRAA